MNTALRYATILLLASLAAVLSQGCTMPIEDPALGPPRPVEPHIEFHGDVEFTMEERWSIQKAASTWAIQTSGMAQITIIWDLDFSDTEGLGEHQDAGHSVILRLTSDTTDEDEGVLAYAGSGGVHNPWGKPVLVALIVDRMDICDILVENCFTNTIIHEFGHALGIPHVGTPAAIMYPSQLSRPHTCLTQPDLSAFCEVNVCTRPVYPCENR
jgi:hypothetical protein